MFTDTHCHLEKQYYDDYDKIINNANNNGVVRMISCGCTKKANIESIKISNKYSNIYSTIGYHPDQAEIIKEEDILDLKNLILSSNKVIGIGEIGLDYHYEGYDKNKQSWLFKRQLELAQELNLPVVIHSRDATLDTINILKDYKIKGVIHSFSGSYETAMIYIKMGFKLGINGVVTFKNSKLKDTLIKLSPSDIVLETDAPYLTPHPFRGEKNESKNIILIAEFISNLYGITIEELSKITNNNIESIFDI